MKEDADPGLLEALLVATADAILILDEEGAVVR